MPLTMDRKEVIVQKMAEDLKGAAAIVVTDYRGLSVDQLGQLRGMLRKDDASFFVIKNTLCKRAFEVAGLSAPSEALLTGPTAIAVLRGALSAPAKTLLDFEKKSQILKMRGVVMEGQEMGATGVKSLSELPTRDELRSMLLGVISGPARSLVTVVSAPMRDVAGVLQARVRKGDEAAA